jgi:hypothetical protein
MLNKHDDVSIRVKDFAILDSIAPIGAEQLHRRNKATPEDFNMTVKDRDALDRAIIKMRALFMAIKGADSIADQNEADALEALAGSVLDDFEDIESAIESVGLALAA